MLFFTGHHSSGKSTVAAELKNIGYVHIETGQIVRNLYIEESPALRFEDWAREKGKKLDEELIAKIMQVDSLVRGCPGINGVVVTGNRQIQGIRAIQDALTKTQVQPHLIIYFECSFDVLYVRQKGRIERDSKALSYEDFITRVIQPDRNRGVEDIRNFADKVVDSSRPVSSVTVEIIDFIEERGFSRNVRDDLASQMSDIERRSGISVKRDVAFDRGVPISKSPIKPEFKIDRGINL